MEIWRQQQFNDVCIGQRNVPFTLIVLSRIQIERLFCCCFCFDFFCFVSMESIRAKVTYSYVVVDDEDDDDGEFDVPDYDDEDGYAMPQA